MIEVQTRQAAVTLRPGRPADTSACGRICYEAFETISRQHNFAPDFPSVDIATGLISMLLSHPNFFSVVAEADGEVVGSNFLDERSVIAGVGPITVNPKVQNLKIGRRLMQTVLDRAAERKFAGVRLLQAAYHCRSLALYATLGFLPREPIACMQGPAIGVLPDGYRVRPAVGADLEACNLVCAFVHGHDRAGELLDAIKLKTGNSRGTRRTGDRLRDGSGIPRSRCRRDQSRSDGADRGRLRVLRPGHSRAYAQRRVVSVVSRSRPAYRHGSDSDDDGTL